MTRSSATGAPRIYLGKPMELFVAQHLEGSGISIVGLEATGRECDIIGLNNGENVFAEVKFIGTDDATFSAIEKSVTQGGVIVGFGDLPTAHDYLISRLFEAAKQLEAVGRKRIAIAVIDDYTSWPIFKLVLEKGWINWKAPGFISSNAGMKQHLDKLRLRFPNLDEEVTQLSRLVCEIRIYRLLGDFRLELHSIVTF